MGFGAFNMDSSSYVLDEEAPAAPHDLSKRPESDLPESPAIALVAAILTRANCMRVHTETHN